MPLPIVRRVWANGIRHVEALAEFFDVPEYVVDARLKYLGLVDDEARSVKMYFRQIAPNLLPNSSSEIVGALA